LRKPAVEVLKGVQMATYARNNARRTAGKEVVAPCMNSAGRQVNVTRRRYARRARWCAPGAVGGGGEQAKKNRRRTGMAGGTCREEGQSAAEL